jgi:hypothetical protein
MGTFFKSYTRTNVLDHHTITDSGTPGTVVDFIYENTSDNDFVLFKCMSISVGGSTSFQTSIMNVWVEQKNYQTNSYVGTVRALSFACSPGATIAGPNVHQLFLGLAAYEDIAESGRLYFPYAPPAVNALVPPFILWPRERVRVESNITLLSGSPSNYNFQFAAHIIRNVG